MCHMYYNNAMGSNIQHVTIYTAAQQLQMKRNDNRFYQQTSTIHHLEGNYIILPSNGLVI